MRVLATAVLLGLACAAAGCGDRSEDAAAVAGRFESALAARDGARACAELGRETANALSQQEGAPCSKAILDLGLPAGGRVAGTSVYVTSALVRLRDGDAIFLDEGPDGWEVSGAGCTPAGPDRPFDCELED